MKKEKKKERCSPKKTTGGKIYDGSGMSLTDLEDAVRDEGDAGGSAMAEERAPREPSVKELDGMSGTKKERMYADYRQRVSDAKKRQSDRDNRDAMYMERRTKGIRFSDKKGSGYIRRGVKHYD